MKTEIDRLAAARPEPSAPAAVVGADERRLLISRIVAAPAPAGTPAPASRPADAPAPAGPPHPPRRPVLTQLLPVAAVGAVALIAGTVAALPEPPSARGPATSAPSATAAPGPATVDYVVARAESALSGAAGRVLKSTWSFRSCKWVSVTLLGTGATPVRARYTETCGGRPGQDIGQQLMPGRPDHLLVTTVRHDQRTWSRRPNHVGAPAEDGFPAPSTPDALRRELAEEQLVLVGRERIDGRETIQLRGADSPHWPRAANPRYWVDASTYLLVRSLVQKGEGAARVQLQADHAWLEPTAAALARLDVPVPAGYRRVVG